jgi:hypothetical protein
MRMRPFAALPLLLIACGPGSGDSRDDTATAATPATTSGASADTTTTTAVDPTTTVVDPTTTAATSSASTTAPDPTTTGGLDDSTTRISTTEADDSTGPAPKLDLPPVDPIPVHEIPGLESITFYETTGQVTEYTFLVDGPELSNLLVDPLSSENRDIQGTSVEFYDVYYSDVGGVFDPDGSYLTIAGAFGAKLPAGGGLNLAEISLNYADDSVEFGSFLASFQGLGDNYAPGSEPNAIDGDLMTHTTMGNNVDEPTKRLRVTLGFMSSLMPG